MALRRTQHDSARIASASLDKQPLICMHAPMPLRSDIRLRRNASALSACGFRVAVIDVEEGCTRAHTAEFEGARVGHIRLPARFSPYYHSTSRFVPWILFKGARIALGTLKVMRTQADVYHASDIMAFPACYIAARLRRRPLVLEGYELPLTDRSISGRPLLRGIATLICRKMIRKSQAFISTSPRYVEEIEKRFPGPRMVLVRNIPPYRAALPSEHIRDRLDLRPLTRIALYQGYFQPNRGLQLLIRAARYLTPDQIIVLLGMSGGTSVQELQDKIDEEGVEDRIKILPAVPPDELHDWTASANLGLNVLPTDYSRSITLCLPNKVFQYLMAGLPVLTSQLDACVELVERYDVGRVVRTLDPVDVGTAISAMLADTAALERMRQNALAACERELRWEVEREQLIKLYRDLLEP